MPMGLFNYVRHSRTPVILHNAIAAGDFTQDPYVQTHQLKSALCTPLIQQGRLSGILYLENNLVEGAFTSDRIQVLEVLLAQAAIALENAQLYATLERKVQERTAQLAQANREITQLNRRLKAENTRMSAELAVSQRLQALILPRSEELEQVESLEIAAFMEPADEVSGDYYDVLQLDDQIQIGIGDVTGHGLESGMLMLMAQTAVRALRLHGESDATKILNTLNQTIYANVQRMQSDRNMTLTLLDYRAGRIGITGQHESVIVVRRSGQVDCLDTIDLGFPLGLEQDIADFVAETHVDLEPGDGLVLYTDGITEAENAEGDYYGVQRLCDVIQRHWNLPAAAIRTQVIQDIYAYIGDRQVLDDITLVVCKLRHSAGLPQLRD